jgi:transcriptional regulator with XRE-family HTH domain
MATFGKILRQLRDAKGMSEQDLADKSGVPFDTVRSYGKDASAPGIANAVKLAVALNVSLDAFRDVTPVGDDKAD